MSSAFVTGASGYIGHHVAVALRAAGYRVYGLVRSQEKGELLIRNEVIPVVGDLNQPETYQEVLAKSTYVIDTVLDRERLLKGLDPNEPNRLLLEAAAKLGDAQGVKKTFIYTSGVLVYTDSQEWRDENTQPNSPAPFKSRIDFETAVRNHPGVRGIVLRPGFVYGGAFGAGNHLIDFLKIAQQDKIVIFNGVKSQRWNWVHVVDLADAYVKAVKKSHSIAGEAFNIVSDSSPTYEQGLLAVAKIAGFKGTVEYSDQPGNDILSRFGTKTVLLTHNKARELLDWVPQHLGALDELDIYYHTIKGQW